MSSSKFDFLRELEKSCRDIFQILLPYLDSPSLVSLFSTCSFWRDYPTKKRFWEKYWGEYYSVEPLKLKLLKEHLNLPTPKLVEDLSNLIKFLDTKIGYVAYREKYPSKVQISGDDSESDDELEGNDRNEFRLRDPSIQLSASVLGLEKLVSFYLTEGLHVPLGNCEVFPPHIARLLIERSTINQRRRYPLSHLRLYTCFGTVLQFREYWNSLSEENRVDLNILVPHTLSTGNFEVFKDIYETKEIRRESLIYNAAEKGQLEIVKYLLEKGNRKIDYFRLIIAAVQKSFALVKYLLQFYRPKTEDEIREILRISISYCQAQTFKYFWQPLEDENFFGSMFSRDDVDFGDGSSTYDEEGFMEILDFLLENHPNLNDDHVDELFSRQEYEIVKILLKHDLLGYSYLCIALSPYDPEIFKLLMGMTKEKGILNPEDQIPFPFREGMMKLALNLDVEVISIVLDRGCVLPSNLEEYIGKMDYETYRFLEDKFNFNNDEKFETTLQLLEKGHFSLVKYLLESLDLDDSQIDRLLIPAIRSGYRDRVRYVLDRGAEFPANPVPMFKEVIPRIGVEMFKYLLENAKHVKRYQKKIMKYIVKYGYPYFFSVYLAFGLRIDTSDKKYMRKLMKLAVLSGNTEKVERLLRLGCDAQEGLEIAIKYKMKKLRFFTERGAKIPK